MSDDFEKAVIITFSFDGSHSPQLKEQAAAYVNNIKRAPECWRLCVERFSASPYSEVKFWCLQTLHELIRGNYSAFAEADKATMRAALMTWVTRDCNTPAAPMPPFLRNKVAQTLVAVLQYEYPASWPSFFHDLIAALGGGEGVVDMFCRILVSIDADIISLEIPRSQDESRLSMHVKDSMREASIGPVAGAWYRLIDGYRDKAPGLAAQVLGAMQRYVSWIDIGLVANDKFLSLLLSLVDSPHPALRGAAVECVTEVLAKRMEPLPKLKLIQSMKIVPVAATWSRGFPPALAGDPEAAVAFARLLGVLAGEVMDALKRVENGVISLTAVGLPVSSDAASEAAAAAEAAGAMLAALFPPAMGALKSGEDEVALPLLPFLAGYVTRLKALAKRSPGGLPPDTLAQVRSLLEGIAVAAEYPRDGAAYGGAAPSAPQELAAAAEEQVAVEEKRRELFTLFKNVAKICFDEAAGFVGAALGAALSGQGVAWQDVEVAITLLYEAGEGAPEDALRGGPAPESCGRLAALALALLQRGPPPAVASHRLVALAVLEVAVRYSRALQQAPAAVPAALAAFLDGRGLGHPAEDVHTRAAYLFSRLVKMLRQNVRPYLPDVLASLQPHLQRILTTPPPAAAGGAAAAEGGGGAALTANKASAPANAYIDDRLYVFDALGMLLGQEELAAEQQAGLLGQLVGGLRAQVRANLQPLQLAAAAVKYGGGGAGAEGAVAAAATGAAAAGLIMQAMEAMTRLSKGFRTDLVVRQRPQLGELLGGCLAETSAAAAAAPEQRLLRARFCSLVHRLVECLGPGMLPRLPEVLQLLLASQGDVQDLVDLVVLVNQLLARYREALGELCGALLPPLLAAVHGRLGPDWDWSGRRATPGALRPGTDGTAALCEEARERGELQRALYLLLSALTGCGLSGALLRLERAGLEGAVVALTRGAATHVDPNVRRTCLQVFSRLVSDWCGSPAGAPAGPNPAAPGQPAAAPPPGPASPTSAPAAANGGGLMGAGEVVPGFRRYAMERLGEEACLVGLLRPAAGAGGGGADGAGGGAGGGLLDVRDAAVLNLLGEAAGALKLIYAKCGEEFPAHLMGTVLPALGLSPAAAQQLIALIREGEAKQLRDFLRALIAGAAQQQQQQVQQAAAAAAAGGVVGAGGR